MPSEERYINFNLDEIYQAISMGCIKEKKDPLPKGSLTKIEIHEDDPEQQNSIFVHIGKEAGGDDRIEFDRTFFALSLVFYCQGSGIPIPAKGKKTLNIREDQIVMKIELARKDV